MVVLSALLSLCEGKPPVTWTGQPEQAIEQTVDRHLVRGVVMFMWCHCTRHISNVDCLSFFNTYYIIAVNLISNSSQYYFLFQRWLFVCFDRWQDEDKIVVLQLIFTWNRIILNLPLSLVIQIKSFSYEKNYFRGIPGPSIQYAHPTEDHNIDNLHTASIHSDPGLHLWRNTLAYLITPHCN